MSININTQIAKYRKQMNITQEELAKAMGVTNQAVSKWEAAACCPDIQLLPELAKFFGISIDELMGAEKPTPQSDVQDMCDEIKALFQSTPEEEHFALAYKLSIILHKCVVSRGFTKDCVHRQTNTDKPQSTYENWGASICSEPDGETVYMRNCTFFSNHKSWRGTTVADIRSITKAMKRYSSPDTLKVMLTIYELTINDFNLFVSLEEICDDSKLSKEDVLSAIDKLDEVIMFHESGERYRLNGACMHIPPMLMVLGEKTD